MTSKKDDELAHGFAGPGYGGFAGSAGYHGSGVGGIVGGYAGSDYTHTCWRPPPPTHHDDRLRGDIAARLSMSPEVDASLIEVQVEAGQATLRGSVPTRHMKHVARSIAESVPGVLQVQNRLHVEHWFSRGAGRIKARPA
jgi:hypothetical protein